MGGALLTVHYMPNQLGHARLGLIVGRKIAKRAVQRNYMKRVLRELFRQQQPELPGLDLLVRPNRPFTRPDHAAIRAEFLQLLERLHRRTGSRQA